MHADATALAEAIGCGEMTARQAMERSLAAADKHEALGAICYLDAEQGLASADAFDALPEARRKSMPFGGVPTLAKDLGGPFKGFPVSAGSKSLPRQGGEADSDLAARYRDAGFCLFGITTTPEFGLSLASEPLIGPISKNPLDPSLTSGGSSGGAAAAVAAGIVSIAHATDAGGSIRVPAACCGLVGLKPGRGAMAAGPLFTNHLGGIASELAVCRSVRDAERAFSALSGSARGPYPPVEQAAVKAGKLRIGLLAELGSDFAIDPVRAEAVEDAARALEAEGHEIVSPRWGDIRAIIEASGKAFRDVIAINLASLAKLPDIDASLWEPMTQAVADEGALMSGVAVWDLVQAMVYVSRDLHALFDRFDCLLTPMLASAPRPIGSFPSDHRDTDLHFARMGSFAPLAAIANSSGFPAITLPFGVDKAGLPLPVQMIAPMGHEALLLALAARLEGEERWSHPFPITGLDR
ncbi:amidase [Aliirhizobium cellulosilyticum]|uniref:Indoleacetamide hydrolase n=1 Tax=Aliirhizobium cellulosilyticum TaxID=393664 RepID=A0A7W6TGL1_9HYPH|nr:amidase [Rhizobium cellulosilyticum]MBB4349908.1 amidase [Rhizobium cellulosilyticum]MBB4413087.1 amidase [Rhizobium cellulosilyticum]MBB4447976.1 amidase [Rhizobium cellulosilyticum]